MMPNEEWRAVVHNDHYEVSSLGRVRRCKPDRYGRGVGRMLTPATNLHGYLFVGLVRDRKNTSTNIHALVCEAFHGPKPTPRHEVAHGDGDQTNNAADNLRWATRKENFADRDAHGRTARGATHFSATHPELCARGEGHGMAKLTEANVIAIKSAPAYFGVQSQLARQFGISQQQISDIRNGKSWRHIDQPAALSAAA